MDYRLDPPEPSDEELAYDAWLDDLDLMETINKDIIADILIDLSIGEADSAMKILAQAIETAWEDHKKHQADLQGEAQYEAWKDSQEY